MTPRSESEYERPTKLAIITSHPIQYQAPLFRLLDKEVDLRVMFGYLPNAAEQARGFGGEFEWDIPLTSGYSWEVFGDNHGALRSFPKIVATGVRVAKRLAKFDAVALFGWHHPTMISALIALQAVSVPCLFRGEDNLLTPRKPWRLLIHQLLLQKFAGILSIGKANQKYYNHLGFSSDKIFSCPYFSDTARLAQECEKARNARRHLRRKWSIPENATCFLFCGKLTTKKRPADFLRAGLKVPNSHLLLVGSGDLERTCKDKYGAPNVTFAGFLNQSDIATAYAAADVLVLPSDAGETWGLVVNEAMGCGMPAIVSSMVGCGEDLIQEGQTGFTYPYANVEALASKMHWFVENRELIPQMGAKASALISGEYSVECAGEGIKLALSTIGNT